MKDGVRIMLDVFQIDNLFYEITWSNKLRKYSPKPKENIEKSLGFI